MSSYVISPFHGLPMTEVVPDAVEVKGVSKSSILTGRRKIRFTPQNGTTAGPGSIIQFVLADSTCLLDVNSMVISYNATITGANGTATMDDGPAWCRRAQVSLNGNLVDDTDNAHRTANMSMYLNGDRSWYSGPGSFAGWWALNPDIGNNYATLQSAVAQGATYNQGTLNSALTAFAPRYGDVGANLANSSARFTAGAGANGLTGVSQAVPLGLLSASLRGRQYWPLSQMGECVIQLTVAPANEALWGAGTTQGTYSLTDIYLECDLISPHFMYQELLNKVTQMEDQHGLVIPVNTTIVTQGQQIPGGSAQDTSIVVSRATNNLRQVLMVNVPSAGVQSYGYPGVSCFPCEGFQQVQYRIGSLYFPSQPSNSLARAFWMSQNSFGEPVNDRGGVVNMLTYGNTTGAGGAGGSGATGVVTNLTAGYGPALAYSDSFVLAYDFDNYKGGERLDSDGVSVLGQAGSQLQIQLRNAPVEPIQPIVALVATKYIQLKDGTLSIKGV